MKTTTLALVLVLLTPTLHAGDLASIALGKENISKGIELVKFENPGEDGYAVEGVFEGASYRATHAAAGARYLYFNVDADVPADAETKVVVVAKSDETDPSLSCGLTLTYESGKGYVQVDEWFTLPHDGAWHEHTFTLKDPNFKGQWGWHFRIDAISSAAPVQVKEVRIKKAD